MTIFKFVYSDWARMYLNAQQMHDLKINFIEIHDAIAHVIMYLFKCYTFILVNFLCKGCILWDIKFLC